ncbi:hypothetical protein BX666DRAFT_1159476 [Dichotomocladium elegans]|nr:hypothetical protein BX666DRAFT_1159476 [Dichotomocladium elegans]
MLYHLKAINNDDQAKWTKALREFRTTATAALVEEEQGGDDHNENGLMLPPTPTLEIEHERYNFKQQVKSGLNLSMDLLTDIQEYMRTIDQLLSSSQQHQLASEKQRILDSIAYQQSLWRTLNTHFNDMLVPSSPSASASAAASSRNQDASHLTIPGNMSPFIHSNGSWRGSVISDQYFDAEEILLSEECDSEEFVNVDHYTDDDDDDDDYIEEEEDDGKRIWGFKDVYVDAVHLPTLSSTPPPLFF